MKILQILPELNAGGVETGTVDFARYLVNHGHESIVVSNGGAMVAGLEKSGTKHYTLPVHRKSIFGVVKLVRALRKIIVDEKVDIVHARSRVPAWIAYFACRKTNATFITTCHGFYKNPLLGRAMGWGKLVIVPSNIIGRHMIENFGVPNEVIRCIPRGVDLAKFPIKEMTVLGKSTCTIAMVGRITPLKGHSYFLQSVAKLVRSIPYLKVWIIGEAPAAKQNYREELEVLVKRLGLEKHVEFLGRRSDIPELLMQSDLLVMSSTEPESFGRVILEAQAVGVPVVATAVGGVVDIIDHEKTGLLVPSKDPDAMAAAMLRLLQDKPFARDLVLAAQDKLREHFTVEKMASQTLAVYEEALQSLNILVIKLSSLGDVVLVTASLRALRQKFPDAIIKCLVGKDSYKALKNCPYVDELIIYDHRERDKGFPRFWLLTKALAKERFDKVIDFQNSKKSHLLAFLTFARETYGYDHKKWGFLLTHALKNNRKDIGPVEHQFEILKLLGISYTDRSLLELWPSEAEKKHVNALFEGEWLTNSKNIVGINISASAAWPTKNWPVEYMAKLCDVLSHKNIRVVITGVERDMEMVKKLQSLAKSKPSILVGKTDVLQLAAVMKRCKVFLSQDSAPLHIAAAMNVPVIAFFGPTDARRHAPPAKKIVILNKKLACSPCYSGRCKILTHACMRDITVDQVVKEIEAIVGDKE